jgi:DNA-binding CsgD family transcriptional regulator
LVLRRWQSGGPAIATSRIERQCTFLEEAALQWLDREADGRAMVDGDLKILWTNAPAAILLGSSFEIEERRGILSAVDRSKQAQLRAFVGRSRTGRSAWNLPRPDGNGFLLLTAIRSGPGEVFGLSLKRTGPEHPARYHELDAMFGLTAAEHRVLLSLLAGNEADVVAALQDVSIETTRSHIRSIYLKLGVNSRERLFALAQDFQI